MSRPKNSQHRQRLSPAQYQPEVRLLAAQRQAGTLLEMVTPEMEEAAVAVFGLISASGPKVRERIRTAVITASIDRERDVRDQLAGMKGYFLEQY